jgi:D-alanyl-D-alanine carboxypeptidase
LRYCPPVTFRFLTAGVVSAALLAGAPNAKAAGAMLLVEADSGKVLHAENAAYPWYPASVTKLMTAYLVLRAVKENRIALDTLLTVSDRAMAQQPSKMGFKTGVTVTVDNALKMLMVKSANDMAVVLAEGVAGSVEKFSDQMNAASQRLGMSQSSWTNPNGLPADEQITSARDMAILARAVIQELPEYEMYWRIPAIKFGRKLMRNTNSLIDRYPGADGMKTGFICASGFNVVATATRNGKRLIAVVFGAPSSAVRAERTAALFERGFNGTGLSWLMPSLGTVDKLAPIAAAPPNMREEMCGKNRKRPASENDNEEAANQGESGTSLAALLPLLNQRGEKPASLLGPLTPSMPPVVVFAGPPKKPSAAKPAQAALTPAASAKPAPKPAAKPAAAAPAKPAAKPAAAKPAAKPAASKPAASKPAAAKPPAAKPAAKPASAKPASAKEQKTSSAAPPAKPAAKKKQ